MILIFFSFFAKKRQHGSQDQLKLITKMNCIKKLKVFDWISPKLWLWKLEDVHFERLSFFYDFWNWESLTACAVLAFEPKSGCYWPPTVWFLHSAMGHFLRILEEREEQLQKNIHKYCFFALYLDQYNLHTYAPIKKETSGLYTWHQTSYYISCCIFMTNKNPNTILSGCVPQPKTKITCNIEKSR